MAIKFKHGGRTWEADTADEAIALRQRLELQDQVAIESGEEPDWIAENIWTPDSALELLKGIGPQQKKFLRVLFDRTEVTDGAVMQELKLASAVVLAGVLSGLSKQLKKLDIKPWDLYTVRVKWDGKDKGRSFCLSSGFRWVATELGWPKEWA